MQKSGPVSGEFYLKVLDSLEAHIAVLDQAGTIIAVNEAWKQFTLRNGSPSLNSVDVGVNYLDVCARAGSADTPEGRAARVVFAGIRDVLSGQRSEFSHEYPCHAPSKQRWFLLQVYPYCGHEQGAVVAQFNITMRKKAELRLEILSAAGETLASSLDYAARLSKVAWLAVPRFADWCAVDIFEKDELVRHMAVAHQDPAKVQQAQELQHRYPLSASNISRLVKVMRSGRPRVFRQVTDKMLRASAYSPTHYEMLRQLNIKTALVLPLVARLQVLGAITFMWSESDWRYDHTDLAVAKELARRVAVAVENSQLYQAEQTFRQRAEQAQEQTARLQAITASLVTALTPEQVASVIVNQGLTMFEADSGIVTVLDKSRNALEIIQHDGYPKEVVETWQVIPLSVETPLSRAIRSRQPQFIESRAELAAKYPDFARQALTDNEALVSLPLMVEHRVIGCIGLSFKQRKIFSEGERDFALALARQCAQALDRAELYQTERVTRKKAVRLVNQLSSLQSLMAALSRALMPQQVAQVIFEHLSATLKARGGIIALTHEDNKKIQMLDCFGYPQDKLKSWQSFGLHETVPLAETARQGVPIFINTAAEFEARYPHLAPAIENYQAFVTLPLMIKDKAIGSLGLSFERRGNFSEETQVYLTTIARQCAQALERARLYEVEQRARAEAEAARQTEALLAETRERQRLAQDLHDNVAQALGYLNLKVGIVTSLLEQQDNQDEILNHLAELKKVVGEAYTDVREEIFYLRSGASLDIEFLKTLQDYVAKYQRHYKLNIVLDKQADDTHLDFAGEVGVQLMRTIQEALINVRKHAGVNQATIRLERLSAQTRISILDHGRGFELDQQMAVNGSSFGLQIMRERIEKIGGQLEIVSAPGQGTQVTLLYPATAD